MTSGRGKNIYCNEKTHELRSLQTINSNSSNKWKKKQHTTSECCASDSNEIARSVAFSNESTHENKTQKRSGKEKNCFSSNSKALSTKRKHTANCTNVENIMWNFRAEAERRRGKIVSICLKFAVQQTHATASSSGISTFPPNCVREVKNSLGFFFFSLRSRQSLSLYRRSSIVSHFYISKRPSSLGFPFHYTTSIIWFDEAGWPIRALETTAHDGNERGKTRNEAIHIQMRALLETDGSEKTENFSKPPSVIALLQTHQVENIGQRRRRNKIFFLSNYTTALWGIKAEGNNKAETRKILYSFFFESVWKCAEGILMLI